MLNAPLGINGLTAALCTTQYTPRIFFRNLIKSNRDQIVFTILRLIWNQMDSIRLVLNQSVHGKYNLISVWFDKIPKKLLWVSRRIGAIPPSSSAQHFFCWCIIFFSCHFLIFFLVGFLCPVISILLEE